MTMKHMLDGAMQHTKARNHHQFARLAEIDAATISRIARGEAVSIRIETLDVIQRATGISADTLMTWYRLPDDAVLGRIQEGA